jgi:RNA polymerase sigma-70 factor (ECF subfamily)
MVTFSSGGVRGGLLRFPLPGPSAEGTPGSAGQKTRRGPSAIVRGAVTFEDVVREHQDAVFGAALRILGDRELALDAANQAFMKAYRSIGSYDPTRPIRHWLLRIAVNEAITIGRARARDRAKQVPEADAAAVADRGPTPESEALGRESRDAIRAAVARLPRGHRAPLLQRAQRGRGRRRPGPVAVDGGRAAAPRPAAPA